MSWTPGRGGPASGAGWAGSAPEVLDLLAGRRSCPRLADPAPGHDELHAMLVAASSPPDHGRLRTWRFVVVRGDARVRLGEVFARAHVERGPVDDPQLRAVRAKPLRAPVIVAVIATSRPHPKVPRWEQRAAAACAAYGLLLAAHACGYGAMWRTGWYGEALGVRDHLGMDAQDDLSGWVYLGSLAGDPAPARMRPAPRVDHLR